MKFSHLIYRTPLIYLWYCIRMCVVWKGATAPCPGAGGVGDGHWHMHTPSPGTFFCQAPAQPRACGDGCAGRCTLSFMAWFFDGLRCVK